MMNKRACGRWVSAVSLVLASAFAVPAQAYSSLFVFGDSLSDAGNNAALLWGPPLSLPATGPAQITGNDFVATLPSAAGTYSNGPVWAQLLAPKLGAGVTANPSLLGGSNFASGGAETSVQTPVPGLPGVTTFSLQSQLNTYLGLSGGTASGSALYVLEGGSNNVRRLLSAGPALDPAAVAQEASNYAHDVGHMVDQLQAAGAQHIIVWNTPNLGLTPEAMSFGAGASMLATAVASQFNADLAARLAGESGVQIYDVYSAFTALAAAPGAFGLSNVTTACGNNASGCGLTPLFWDGIHPTTVGHQLLANGMLALAVPVPEPSTAVMLLIGLAGCAWSARRRSH